MASRRRRGGGGDGVTTMKHSKSTAPSRLTFSTEGITSFFSQLTVNAHPSFTSREEAGTSPDLQRMNQELLHKVESDLNSCNFQFVELMPKEVHTDCAICLSLLQEPCIVECCGNRFCKRCIEQIVCSCEPCPLCKCKRFKCMPDKYLQRLLKQRKVFCLLKEEGCDWTGEMDRVGYHLQLMKRSSLFFSTPENDGCKESCKYVPVECSLCKVLVKRGELNNHQKVCPQRKVLCEYCQVCYPMKEMSEHCEKCPSVPVLCTNKCTLEYFERCKLATHLEEQCPLQVIRCEHHYAGCQVCLLRREMPSHLREEAVEHLAMVSNKYQELEASFEDLKKRSLSGRQIQYLYVSNLMSSMQACDQKVRSRFGQFGTVTEITMIPSHSAVLVGFENQWEYKKALTSGPINLLRQRLNLTPVYTE